ncbi:MAG: YbhB/YbcL family Raf kinase inhibitor-like protein [Chloroflexi bacterium]|nr:YbhB/YbcL family Raf kinase inhibitor-like protein [Chloroflexota bacterium]
MQISSPALQEQQPVPIKYTCYGPNVNPPLEWRDIPPGTESLVLTFEDVDAPANPWVHWLVFNIPVTATRCPENGLPDGATEGIANGGTHGYEGPCMKYFRGTHHYFFRLFALNTRLDLPATADRAAVFAAMDGHVLAEAQLIGTAEGDGSAL